MKKVYSVKLLFIVLSILFLTTGCQKNEQKAKENDFGAVKVINYVNKYGLIENQAAWNKAMKNTDYGREITSYDELQKIVQIANHHASIHVGGLPTWEGKPSLTVDKKTNIKIVNVPSAYPATSVDSKKYRAKSMKYMTKVKDLISQVPASQPLILNLANNVGGDYFEIIGALADYIPNGLLWTEIPKSGKNTRVVLTPNSIKNSHPVVKVRIPKHQLSKQKVIVITNEYTSSAAEFTLLALKRNPNVITVGHSTGGFISSNGGCFFGKDNKNAAVIPIASVKTPMKINGHNHFDSTPIQPDIMTQYQPINVLKYGSKQQPLDDDFIEEMLKEYSNLKCKRLK